MFVFCPKKVNVGKGGQQQEQFGNARTQPTPQMSFAEPLSRLLQNISHPSKPPRLRSCRIDAVYCKVGVKGLMISLEMPQMGNAPQEA